MSTTYAFVVDISILRADHDGSYESAPVESISRWFFHPSLGEDPVPIQEDEFRALAVRLNRWTGSDFELRIMNLFRDSYPAVPVSDNPVGGLSVSESSHV